MTYYWTSEPETPAVYHNNSACPRGSKILSYNRESSTERPTDRRLCEEC